MGPIQFVVLRPFPRLKPTDCMDYPMRYFFAMATFRHFAISPNGMFLLYRTEENVEDSCVNLTD